MSYHLCQVEDRLRKAFDRALQQIDAGTSENRKLSSQKLEPNIGHQPALQQANIAPVLVDGKDRWQYGVGFRQGELKGKMTIIGDPADFNQKRIWTIHARDQRPYLIFLLRAQLYLTYRGIPHDLHHRTARRLIHASQRIGGISMWMPLTIQEEALEFAGIPLSEPTGFRDVEPSLGILKSPATAKVLKAFIKTPPPGGMHRVYPGDKLFLLTVWSTPSISRELPVNAPAVAWWSASWSRPAIRWGKTRNWFASGIPFRKTPGPIPVAARRHRPFRRRCSAGSLGIGFPPK